ncbi:hypothetical protein EBZ37_13190 [bacterium]|nr:hypothetical protein [bacterium]
MVSGGGQMVPLPASLVQVKPGFTVALELTEQVGVVNLTGQEKALAFQIAMMTFNLCNHLVEERILSKEIFAQ